MTRLPCLWKLFSFSDRSNGSRDTVETTSNGSRDSVQTPSLSHCNSVNIVCVEVLNAALLRFIKAIF